MFRPMMAGRTYHGRCSDWDSSFWVKEMSQFQWCWYVTHLANSIEYSSPWKVTSSSDGQEIPPHFLEPEGSLPHSQASITCLYHTQYTIEGTHKATFTIKYKKKKPWCKIKWITSFLFSLYTGWSKSLCVPDNYSTKNTQKYFKQFQSLTMIT
jgi:hypothetical protein